MRRHNQFHSASQTVACCRARQMLTSRCTTHCLKAQTLSAAPKETVPIYAVPFRICWYSEKCWAQVSLDIGARCAQCGFSCTNTSTRQTRQPHLCLISGHNVQPYCTVVSSNIGIIQPYMFEPDTQDEVVRLQVFHIEDQGCRNVFFLETIISGL